MHGVRHHGVGCAVAKRPHVVLGPIDLRRHHREGRARFGLVQDHVEQRFRLHSDRCACGVVTTVGGIRNQLHRLSLEESRGVGEYVGGFHLFRKGAVFKQPLVACGARALVGEHGRERRTCRGRHRERGV